MFKFVDVVLLLNCLNSETILTSFDGRRFAVVHPCLTLTPCHEVSPPQNVQFEPTVILGFFTSQGRHDVLIKVKIRHRIVHRGFTFACHIWPWLVKATGVGVPQNSDVVFAVFAPKLLYTPISLKFDMEEHATGSLSCANFHPILI